MRDVCVIGVALGYAGAPGSRPLGDASGTGANAFRRLALRHFLAD